jgi:hypothetical protein
MSKPLAAYKYKVTKRYRNTQSVYPDTYYSVSVKADSIDQAKGRAVKLAEADTSYGSYIYELSLESIVQL